jgi:hypothetical protein
LPYLKDHHREEAKKIVGLSEKIIKCIDSVGGKLPEELKLLKRYLFLSCICKAPNNNIICFKKKSILVGGTGSNVQIWTI